MLFKCVFCDLKTSDKTTLIKHQRTHIIHNTCVSESKKCSKGLPLDTNNLIGQHSNQRELHTHLSSPKSMSSDDDFNDMPVLTSEVPPDLGPPFLGLEQSSHEPNYADLLFPPALSPLVSSPPVLSPTLCEDLKPKSGNSCLNKPKKKRKLECQTPSGMAIDGGISHSFDQISDYNCDNISTIDTKSPKKLKSCLKKSKPFELNKTKNCIQFIIGENAIKLEKDFFQSVDQNNQKPIEVFDNKSKTESKLNSKCSPIDSSNQWSIDCNHTMSSANSSVQTPQPFIKCTNFEEINYNGMNCAQNESLLDSKNRYHSIGSKTSDNIKTKDKTFKSQNSQQMNNKTTFNPMISESFESVGEDDVRERPLPQYPVISETLWPDLPLSEERMSRLYNDFIDFTHNEMQQMKRPTAPLLVMDYIYASHALSALQCDSLTKITLIDDSDQSDNVLMAVGLDPKQKTPSPVKETKITGRYREDREELQQKQHEVDERRQPMLQTESIPTTTDDIQLSLIHNKLSNGTKSMESNGNQLKSSIIYPKLMTPKMFEKSLSDSSIHIDLTEREASLPKPPILTTRPTILKPFFNESLESSTSVSGPVINGWDIPKIKSMNSSFSSVIKPSKSHTNSGQNSTAIKCGARLKRPFTGITVGASFIGSSSLNSSMSANNDSSKSTPNSNQITITTTPSLSPSNKKLVPVRLINNGTAILVPTTLKATIKKTNIVTITPTITIGSAPALVRRGNSSESKDETKSQKQMKSRSFDSTLNMSQNVNNCANISKTIFKKPSKVTKCLPNQRLILQKLPILSKNLKTIKPKPETVINSPNSPKPMTPELIDKNVSDSSIDIDLTGGEASRLKRMNLTTKPLVLMPFPSIESIESSSSVSGPVINYPDVSKLSQ